MASLESKTIAALLDLLADDSPTVVAAARAKLLHLGPVAECALKDAVSSDEPRLRARARTALLDLRRRDVERRIAELASLPDDRISLEQGALLLAELEDPDFDRAATVRLLDQLGDRMRVRAEGLRDSRQLAEELARLLASEWRLRGNDDSPGDPDNSFVPRVLEKRRGIPISLAAVYLFVAARAGLPLEGIGTPGHFLLRFGAAANNLYIDPTNGRRMSMEEAMRMLAYRGFPARRSAFEPASAREILVRMCSNLMAAYQRRRATRSVERWSRVRERLLAEV
ncbi:MAG TPA: transglutaminase-like domain-containing protein [Planctomycetota bacterium]|nr:transglutaminase-like domain-containing protein [Planctomycetota bacterium]